MKKDQIEILSKIADAKMRKLDKLDLSGHGLIEFPQELLELDGLEILDLSDNKIRSIPEKIASLKNLKDLNLSGNPLEKPVLEVANQGIEAIRNYFSLLKQSTAKLHEAKLLLVGEGAVGKTSLLKRMLCDKFDPDEVTTEGIDINRWTTKTEETNDFRINVWDFGGQEIYHATHQFFLTKRSLYLLVWEARKDNNMMAFDYWLNVVKLLSDSAPIVIVLNKIDERIKIIDEHSLKMKFPNIISFHRVSALTGSGINELITEIKKDIDQLPHIGDTLPKVWLDVRTSLEGLDESYISFTEYKHIAERFGLDETKAEKGSSLLLT